MNYIQKMLLVATLTLGLWVSSVTSSSAALILTDLVEFTTDSSGNYVLFSDGWSTVSGNFPFNLWVRQGGPDGPFLNGPLDDDAPISIPLTDGAYTFGLSGDPVRNLDRYGLNLFFNGSNTPGISVFASSQTSSAVFPPFSKNGGVATPTAKDFFSLTPGANTLVFVDGATTVTLTDYRWAKIEVFNSDLVSPYTTSPNGTLDHVGQFTLDVTTDNTTIPEPSSILLLGSGLFYLGVVAYRQRTAHRSDRGLSPFPPLR